MIVVPRQEYILDTNEQIPVVTRSLLKRHHSKQEILDFIYSVWGNKETRTDDGEICYEASLYEQWVHGKLKTI
jgi:hypothetical protein